MSLARERAHRYGHRAETLALWYLRLKGYRLLAQRYKTPVGEIDLIMRHGNVTVFIEVKARRSVDESLYAVTPQQSRRIAQGAAFYAARHPEVNAGEQRFDIVAVPSYLWPSHIKNAFEGI
jgi:putative endonuclease